MLHQEVSEALAGGRRSASLLRKAEQRKAASCPDGCICWLLPTTALGILSYAGHPSDLPKPAREIRRSPPLATHHAVECLTVGIANRDELVLHVEAIAIQYPHMVEIDHE